MESTEKIGHASISTIWHKIIIGDEVVLINIHQGRVKYRLFGLDFNVMAEERIYGDDEVSEVVSDWLKHITNAAVATAAWEAQQRKQSKTGWMEMTKTENTTTSSIPGLQDGLSPRKYYFAYGSNCHVGSMLSRCPAAIHMGKVILNGHKLVFRSVADIIAMDGGVVQGALWTITPECESALDLYEGYPHYYTKRRVGVRHEELGRMEAMAYVMAGRAHQEPPRAAYRDIIAHGYQELDISLQQLNMAVREAEREYRVGIGNIRKAELDY